MSEFTIKDDSSNHHYRTEIPNILFELGLKPNEFSVYCAIKRAAGDKGACTKSVETFCKECKISRPTLSLIIKNISKENKLLKKPLIFCQRRLTEKGDADTHLLTIIDIWPENYEYFKKINRGGQNEGGGGQNDYPGGGQNDYPKEEPIFKKNNKPPLPPIPKIQYREYVFLTEQQFQTLKDLHGLPLVENMLDILNAYSGSKGKSYKSDYHTMTIGGWVFKEATKRLNKPNQSIDRSTKNMDGTPYVSKAEGLF